MNRSSLIVLSALGGIALTVSLAFVAAPADAPAPEPAPTTTIDEAAPVDVTVNEDPAVAPEPAPTLEPLPPCPTEDSPGCYWDASEMGNGDGTDVVNPPEPVAETPSQDGTVNEDRGTRPADGQRADGPWLDYDTGTLQCGVNAGVAIDTDPYGNSWAYCEPALADR